MEYVYFPSPEQQVLARRLVDNGVDLIVGHHPHVVQGIEKYKRAYILYSLGNLFFDTDISNVRKSIIVRIKVSGDAISSCKVIPLELNNNHQPCRITGPREKSLLKFVEHLSTPLTPAISEEFWFEQASETYLRSYKSSYITLMKKYGAKPMISFFLGLSSPFLVKNYAGFVRSKLRRHTLMSHLHSRAPPSTS